MMQFPLQYDYFLCIISKRDETDTFRLWWPAGGPGSPITLAGLIATCWRTQSVTELRHISALAKRRGRTTFIQEIFFAVVFKGCRYCSVLKRSQNTMGAKEW